MLIWTARCGITGLADCASLRALRACPGWRLGRTFQPVLSPPSVPSPPSVHQEHLRRACHMRPCRVKCGLVRSAS
eukprot:3723211-Alexandrium_andersonii.AAC.1